MEIAIILLVSAVGLWMVRRVTAPEIRARVRALPVAEAYAALQHNDPEAAARLNANDVTRISRALEVALSTGQNGYVAGSSSSLVLRRGDR